MRASSRHFYALAASGVAFFGLDRNFRLSDKQKSIIETVAPGISEAVRQSPRGDAAPYDATEIALGAQRLLLDPRHRALDDQKHRRRKTRSESVSRVLFLEFIRWSRVAHDVYLPTPEHFLRSLRLEPRALLKANLEPRHRHHPGFVLYRDFENKMLVLALRANEPVSEFLTNPEHQTATMPFLDSYAHEPSAKSANALHTLLSPYISQFLERHPEYDLLITGHSMGAGVGSLLTLKLAEAYPRIQCFAYATPPVCSPELAKECQRCVHNVILNSDLVPRSTPQGYQRLLTEIEGNIQPIRNRLQEAAPSAKSGTFAEIIEKTQNVGDPQLQKMSASLKNERREIINIEKRIEKAIKEGPRGDSTPPLVTPGKVYLVTRASNRGCNMAHAQDHQFDIYAIEDPDKMSEVFLEETCLEDHSAARYEDHLQFAFHQLYEGQEQRIPEIVDDALNAMSLGYIL